MSMRYADSSDFSTLPRAHPSRVAPSLNSFHWAKLPTLFFAGSSLSLPAQESLSIPAALGFTYFPVIHRGSQIAKSVVNVGGLKTLEVYIVNILLRFEEIELTLWQRGNTNIVLINSFLNDRLKIIVS